MSAGTPSGSRSSVRLAVFLDQKYWRQGDAIYAQRSFVIFLAELAARLDRLVLLGRLDPRPGKSHYRLAPHVQFTSLPYYPSAAHPLAVMPAAIGSVRRFWRVLADVDAVWLLGPHPFALVFAALARMRGRRVVLGVRQDLPSYVRHRHPRRPLLHVVASALDGAYRLAARRYPVIVVGEDLGRRYSKARRLLTITVSLVRGRDVVDLGSALARSYDGELTVLTVGRLDPEKNPLLLPEILARLREHDPRWRLVVCGDGMLREELGRRMRELQVDGAAELRGHVSFDDGLLDAYRRSHFFLHVSHTEGLPQVLIEAFAAGLPSVATAVGGVAEAAAGAALLIPPDDPDAAADALLRIAGDEDLRASLTARALRTAHAGTIEHGAARVARFLQR